MGREGHLGVGVLDEGIHHDHDQDRDRNPKIPNDPSQLRAGGGASGQCPVASQLQRSLEALTHYTQQEVVLL